jgi:hypothetical protein
LIKRAKKRNLKKIIARKAKNTETHNMIGSNWLHKISAVFRGSITAPLSRRRYDVPHEIVPNFTEQNDVYWNVYQSPYHDFLFLGGTNPEELQQAEKTAGKPICYRISVTDADTGHLPGVEIKFPLPEILYWGYGSTSEALNEVTQKNMETFHNAVKTVVGLVKMFEAEDKNCIIYLHCSAGMNRSPAVMARAISEMHDIPIDETLKGIDQVRPVALNDGFYIAAIHENPAEPEWEESMRMLDQENTLQEQQIDLNPPKPNQKVKIPSLQPS